MMDVAQDDHPRELLLDARQACRRSNLALSSAHGLDRWVIDFGSPDEMEGGMRRNLADRLER
jgi:putative long chain acyl-CoA synthase